MEPDLGYAVDASALKSPGVELHLLLLHLRGTHLAQTFRNPRTPIMCPTLSLEIPNATVVFFLFDATISADPFFNAILMKLITCSYRPSTSCFVTQICLPQFSIFELPYPASYCTHISPLITINGLHSSVNFDWRNFFHGKNSIIAHCLNRMSENSSILMRTG